MIPKALTAALGCCLVATGGCRQVLQYADELSDPRTGRTWAVRVPASVGGVLGFAVGLPVDVLALPATGTFYLVEDARTDGQASLLTALLFPSFVLWKAGALIATPFDAIEFLTWRAWLPEPSLNERERERIEERWDREALPRYPVEPVFPVSSA